jgi:hypothetical protein
MKTKEILVLALALSWANHCQAQGVISTAPYWNGNEGISGFGIGSAASDSGGIDSTTAQTFSINGTALVTGITVPIFGYGPVYAPQPSDFQIGLATWNGTEAGSPLLYLSGTQVASGGNWSSFTVNPDVVLASGQEYILLLTTYNFLNTDAGSQASAGYVSAAAYSGGQVYEQTGYEYGINALFTKNWSATPGNLVFTINYTVLPEPSIIALACLGGLLFCSLRRV